MKKFLSLMAAALMAVSLTGCVVLKPNNENKQGNDDKEVEDRLDSSEYREEVSDQVSGLLTDLLEYNDEIGTIATWEEGVAMTQDLVNKSNKYLAKIEKLNPPSKDESFHEDLLEWVSVGYDYNDAMNNLWSDPDTNKINQATVKATKIAEDFDNRLSQLASSESWFKQAVKEFGY